MRRLLLLLAACTTTPRSASDPNAGLFRDFQDGKFDAAGHPLDAVVVDAKDLCPTGAPPCEGDLPAAARAGDLIASARIRVRAHGSGTVVTMSLLSGTNVLAHRTLKPSNLRTGWFDVPLAYHGDGSAIRASITAAQGATVDLQYVEVFPKRFTLALAPGSGTFADTDHLQIELPRGGKIDRVQVDGQSVSPASTRTDTAYRSVVDVAVSDLAPARGDVAELSVHAAGTAARMELRKTAPACAFAGDPAGAKVLITGFQPFPADATHENVSGVAVTALDPSALHGAQVMKLILPVEYDRAAAEVADAIARCQPDVTISFGQGGDEIALEQTAYNLQDTGELSGGAPDNRGIVRAATPIDETAPATRDTQLPIDAIAKALAAIGEDPARSSDPGRYVCNNVMFADLGAMQQLGAGRAGFIHLPYTTAFDDATRARYAGVVAAAIDATVAH